MLKNKQLIVDGKTGDCMRACLTSMLEIPNTDKLPNFTVGNGTMKWRKLLKSMGLSLEFDVEKIWRTGYWMASVPSKNFKNGQHSIVMKGCLVAHDPSTKKRYRAGTNLLGKRVAGGWWLEIEDVSLLPKFREFQSKLTPNKE